MGRHQAPQERAHLNLRQEVSLLNDLKPVQPLPASLGFRLRQRCKAILDLTGSSQAPLLQKGR